MKNTFEIQLVPFCGFYESALYNSDSEYYAIKSDLEYLQEEYGEDKTEEDFEVDYEKYKKDCCEAYVISYKNYTPDYVESLEMTEMTSPRFYNFETDKLYANAVFSEDWRERLIQDMKNKSFVISDFIKKNHTSCDGFTSFMSNDFNEWVKELKKDEPDVRYISFALYYVMMANYSDKHYSLYEDLITDTLDDVYIGFYIKPITNEEETSTK